MKKLISFIKNLIICSTLKEETFNIQHKYEKSYGNKKVEDLKYRVSFLRNLFDYEEKRKNSIDERSSVMMSHLGIILSISCLILTFLIEFFSENTNKLVIITFTILTIVLIFLYIMSIYFIYKNYDATKFNYSYPSPENTKQFSSIESFLEEEIENLIYGIYANEKTNNRKLNNLNIARNYMRWAFYLIAVLISLSIVTFFLHPTKDKVVNVKNAIAIENIDENFSKIQDAIIYNNEDINNKLSNIELKLNNINNKMTKVEK
ncbi:MAG: hypothetical protein J6T23_06900 [Elusimicrobia bacterium]|nr:hypothetical protein [Elusimicrobiota bacterium]